MISTVYRLCMRAYDLHAGTTEIVHLACFAGSLDAANAPLWACRLPTGKLLYFSQPRGFAARLISGMTDISVKGLFSVSLCYCISSTAYRWSVRSLGESRMKCSFGHAILPYIFPRCRVTLIPNLRVFLDRDFYPPSPFPPLQDPCHSQG
jgi:hypothetical protein